MSGFLFHETVFGPVKSRRLGVSLGINLLPTEGKICSFNCIYCECGWTDYDSKQVLEMPKARDIETALEVKLKELSGTEMEPQSITFAGNGEPTLHPEFAKVIDIVVRLRNQYAPKAKVSVLSNGSMLHHEEVFEALKKVDNNILKLDAGTSESIQAINLPHKKINLPEYIKQLKRFDGNLTIQTLFLRGKNGDKIIDNTTENEVCSWLELLKEIKPKNVMIYGIDRATPAETLEKLSLDELNKIGDRVREIGLSVEVYV